MNFFKRCPGCGARFHANLVEKILVKEYSTTTEGPLVSQRRRGGLVRIPMILEVKEYRFGYKCGGCGHEWSETRLEEKRTG